MSSNRNKKPRLNEFQEMEAKDGSGLAPEWEAFFKEFPDLEPTIAKDIVGVSKMERFLASPQKGKPFFLLGRLGVNHPNFMKKHAEKALKIVEAGSSGLPPFMHQGRGPSITDGLEIKLVHDLDLKAFSSRVDELFNWHTDDSVCKEYVAPYFCLVQSSGMGKTKLFTELQQKYNQYEQEKRVCKAILCVNTNLETENQRYFDHKFTVDTSVTESIVDNVFSEMDRIVTDIASSTNEVVLLFDESQGLMVGTDEESGNGSLVFRAIRWWLRKEHWHTKRIVAVFAGTNVALINFFPPDPPKPGPSRLAARHFKNFKQEGEALDSQPADPGFPEAAIYGRPLFSYYYLKGILDEAKMDEFAKRLVLSEKNYAENLASCFSVLGSRVQMGNVTSYGTLSTLISSGYACLVDFELQKTSERAPVARTTFMPDPVCATLAMRFMNEGWQVGALKGKGMKFWVGKAQEAFATKLCLPEKGDTGEIFAALYALFCGDKLRQAGENHEAFGVSLDEWFLLVRNGGKEVYSTTGQQARTGKSTVSSEAGENTLESKAVTILRAIYPNTRAKAKLDAQVDAMEETSSTISFVQVCRNDFRSLSFCATRTLEHMYRAGLGCYSFKNCNAFDITAPIRVIMASQTSYHPLFISIKNWMNVTKGDVVLWMSTMMSFLRELRQERTEPTAVCLIILLGCSDPPAVAGDNLCSSSLAPFPATDVFRFVCVENDEFGIADAIRNLGAAPELSEIYSSHAFVASEDSPDNLLRKSSSNQKDVADLFKALNLSTNTTGAAGSD